MRRQTASSFLMICGILALVVGFAAFPAPGSVAAMPLLQPSPRPPLQPTPDFNGDEPYATAVPTGRITGTIIDLRTGSPRAGIMVAIGDDVVASDAQGNYDHWLSSGLYDLSLQLREGEGTPGQGSQQIAIGPNDTVVVHLFFTSPAPIAPTVAATSVPTATVVPAAGLPLAMPDTSIKQPAAETLGAPTSLPHTAVPVLGVEPGPWLLAGLLLFVVGLLLQFGPRRRRLTRHQAAMPAETLLTNLLANDLRSGAPANDEVVLRDLLSRDL